MTKKIGNPADTPVEVYHWWHDRWCEYLNSNYKDKFVETGLAGLTCTERSPDAPDGSGGLSYTFATDGSVRFIPTDDSADAICEYDSYELGIRCLGDPNTNAGEHIKAGRFRMVKSPEVFAMMMPIQPLMREAFRVAIEDAEKEFDVELPKYW
ncbi:MAG: hypothetical protein HOC20_04810 [Chloroflexi bacterium]|jgi:hypothetical protein|nr:hypothetical protein [Chloroflexota bacterium]